MPQLITKTKIQVSFKQTNSINQRHHVTILEISHGSHEQGVSNNIIISRNVNKTNFSSTFINR